MTEARPLRREGPAPGRAALAAVLVHGRGQSPDFMADVAARTSMPEVHRVYPAAPDNSWYPGRFNAPGNENEPWLTHALNAVDEALAALAADRVPLHRTVLIGFSQGACLLTEHLVRNPRRYAAVALLTGCDISPDGTERAPAGHLDGLPVLMSSSEHDAWVPPARVRASAALLRRMGAHVDLRIHEAREHGVDEDETKALRRLLDAAVPTSRTRLPPG